MLRKRLIYSIFLLLVILLICPACSKTKEKKWKVDIKTVDNVVYVQNPDYPRDGVRHFTLEEELSIGDENDDNQLFIKVKRMAIDKYGNIYVPENKMCFIRVFNSDGKFLRTIGSKGIGPGEFRHISRILIDDEHEILHVLDFKNRRITRLSFNGDRISEIKLVHSMPTIFFMDNKGDYRIFYTKRTKERSLRYYKVFTCSPDGRKSKDSLIIKAKEQMKLKRGQRTITLKTYMEPCGDFVLNNRGELIYGFTDKYELTFYNKSFLKTRVVGRKCSRAARITSEEKDEIVKYYNKLFEERRDVINIKKSELDFPEYHRVFHYLWMTDTNLILVNNFIEEKEVRFDVFNNDGLYIEKWIFSGMVNGLPVAKVLSGSLVFKNGKIYTYVKHENGFLQVKRYRINEKPKSKKYSKKTV